ncbi:hypothetical protein BF29_44 [Heyndrickxia coagulans DSM 1 = ATCC 7050]|uniref:Uncharacterized protein n=1 Tax=Heyndrickxia coagulans TaxID=1398 RepID=A0A150KEP5_HEYCO|nr:hypothetical protein BF29_44 [Heyndrickxia coagulans DSM 1 = ATCC 7050]KYC69603.1 hypothetical protein B4099_0232 [Heyndrickxia coagulans]RGR84159.1 hypothetical protein DWY22_09215 [Heyndrickxia coagulans]RGR97574.1 hypothetical protein DWY16_10230 [Heyndrickxia coagulans]
MQGKKLHACRLAPFLKANKPDHTLHAGLQVKPGMRDGLPLIREKPLKQAAFRLFLFQGV